MNVKEFLTGDDPNKPPLSLAQELFNIGVRWAVVGLAAMAVGAMAEGVGIKEGVDVGLAGLTLDYLGGAALTGSLLVGLFSDEDI